MWPIVVVAVVSSVAVALRRTEWDAVALRVSRWTYGVIMPLSLLYFPIKAGFRVRPVDCEWTFGWKLALYSFGNLPHTAGFAIFFAVTWAQLRNARARVALSFGICLVLGFLVEIAEGATGIHHCRMRDLIPDMTGALIGSVLVLLFRYVRPGHFTRPASEPQ